MSDRSVIFDAVRVLLGRGFKASEVKALDLAIDRYDGAVTLHRLREPEAFFAAVRGITKSLEQGQVDSINAILANAAALPMGQVAYLLATAWHEARFKPIEEWGKGAGKPYGKPGKYGQSQHGRGLVQLTWDANYERADKELALDGALLKDFDLALRSDIAAQILVRGSSEGWFTGKKLSDFITLDWGTFPQFVAARRVINGSDRASMIADLALQFQDALDEGKWQ